MWYNYNVRWKGRTWDWTHAHETETVVIRPITPSSNFTGYRIKKRFISKQKISINGVKKILEILTQDNVPSTIWLIRSWSFGKWSFGIIAVWFNEWFKMNIFKHNISLFIELLLFTWFLNDFPGPLSVGNLNSKRNFGGIFWRNYAIYFLWYCLRNFERDS